MTEREKRWEALVRQTFIEGVDAGLRPDSTTLDLNDLWKKSTARKMAKSLAKEAM